MRREARAALSPFPAVLTSVVTAVFVVFAGGRGRRFGGERDRASQDSALGVGSPLVLVGLIAFGFAVRHMVAREERDLEAAFGDDYREYAARVPRWIIRRG